MSARGSYDPVLMNRAYLRAEVDRRRRELVGPVVARYSRQPRVQFNVRITVAQDDYLRRVAAAHGVTKSELVRDLLFGEREP